MGVLIGWLVSRGLSEQAARIASTVGLFVLVLAFLGGLVAWIRHDAVEDHETGIAKRAAPATDKAAGERSTDAIRDAKSEQEMHDVIAKAPDQPIAPSSRAHACEQLRRAGRRPPACG